ncbi:MAG: carboxylesterase family protein [Planctomycetota bacterium]
MNGKLRQNLALWCMTIASFASMSEGEDVCADFTRFRGADATGVAEDHPNLPTHWNKTKNVSWSVDVPGQGWGSPIVVGDRVFVSSVVADEENVQPKGGLYLGKGVRDPAKGIHHWMVYCFDLKTGQELWKRESHTGRPVVPRHPKSSYAAETPVTDGERLFVLFGDLGLYCYSLDGELLWSKEVAPKKTNMDYGAAASPVIHDDQVFIVYDNKEESWIAAFDTQSGKENWRTPRDETMSWATPFVWENEIRTEIVVNGQRTNRSYSLDGRELWSFDGDMSILVIPSPFAAHGMCYVSSGYVGDAHRPTFAIRPGASGELKVDGEFAKNEFIEWYQPQASPYNTTQIVYGDYLYTVYDQGFMTCHNALTGAEVYGKKRFSPKGSFTASPWAYDGKIFALSEQGLTYVIKAGPEFEVLQTNPLDELCIATPSVDGGNLLVRTLTKLYCISQTIDSAVVPEDGRVLGAAKSGGEVVVETELGPVRGYPSADADIVSFKGIPYAAPPVGPLRWKPPQAAPSWREVRDCKNYGPISLQRKNRQRGGQSEDCLYLNVWTKKDFESEKRPVMVWIHGGGFTQGSGNQGKGGGDGLARKDVVLVSINYRLGALGFMSHPALSAESPSGVSGNYAILDQVAALTWVRENISQFGGDPDNVTIFGESAGGTSVYLLTATPLSKGLFHRAILQSPWLDPVIFRDLKQETDVGPAAEFDGTEQTNRLFGGDAEDVLAKLRAMPAEELLEKVKERWPVATDGYVFPKNPVQIYAAGEQHAIPTLVGTNRDEGTMFAGRQGFKNIESYRAALVERFGENADPLIDFYLADTDKNLRKAAVQLITDGWFVQPARQFARAMDDQGSDVWMYHFTKPVWGWMGAAHAAEIAYVFGKLERPSPEDAELSDAFMNYWVQFAKTGNPNVERLPDWPPYTNEGDQHQRMDTTIETNTGLRSEACDLLDKIRGVGVGTDSSEAASLGK